MGFQISPAVNVKETDLTTIIPSVATTPAAIAGVFRWGPAVDRDLISSENELVERFGKPTNFNGETWLTAASFLGYGKTLWVSRAVSNDAWNSVVTGDGTVISPSNIQIKNKNHYLVSTFADTNILFASKYPGAMGNSLKVSVCDSADAYRKTVALINGATLAFTTGSKEAVLTAATDADAVTILADIKPGDWIKAGDVTVGWEYMEVESVPATPTASSTITFKNTFYLRSNVTMNTSFDRYWHYYNSVEGAPGTSNWVAARGGSGDEIHVVVVDEDGEFTGVPGTILEVFEGLSRAEDARNDNGDGIFVKDVIDNGSKYIWMLHARAGAPFATSETVVPSTNTDSFEASFDGGTEGADELNIPLGDMMDAWDQFKSPEEVDVSLFITGKALHGPLGTDLAKYIISIAEARKDCMVTISPKKETVVDNPYLEAESIVAFRNDLPSTSYAIMDSGYKMMYDRYNEVMRWVPLCGDIAGLIVRTEYERDAWWSPAGFNRGQILNVVKLAYNPNTEADRDLLYSNGVNPVVNFRGEGPILYGDKTLLKKPSAFDRINVRRLFIVLEKSIATAAKYTLFEFNDEITRANFRAMIEPFLRTVKGRRGMYDYRVVCDSTNNTPDIIDRNAFVADIYIKPSRTISYIELNFVAVRTGVTFDEIVGQF